MSDTSKTSGPPTRAAVRESVVGLYGIADAAASGNDPARLCAALLAGGCRLIQLRCKGWPYDDTLRAARAIRAQTREVGAAFVVNDDPHLALEAEADGLHLGQLDGPIGAARAVAGDRWIGRSTNDLEQVAAAVAEGADYVAFGPVFATSNISRPKTVRGLERLTAARRTVPRGIPLVAIGGITADRLSQVVGAGADSWAVIGAIAGAEDPVAATRALISAAGDPRGR